MTSDTSWREQLRHLRPRDDEDGSVTITVSGHRPADISAVPDGVVLNISPANQQTVTVAGCRPGHHLRLRQQLELVTRGEVGTVTAVPGHESRRATVRSRVGRLIIHGPGTVKVADYAEVAIIHSGKLDAEADRVGMIELAGEAELPTEVRQLKSVGDKAAVLVAGRLRVGEMLHNGGGADTGRLVLRGRGRAATQSSPPTTIDRTAGSFIVSLDKVDLTVTQNSGPLTLEGTGKLIVPQNCTLTDVTIRNGVTTHLHPGATILRLAGSFRPTTCQNATVIAGPSEPFTYVGAAAERRSGSPRETMVGATLRGVSIPVSADGRRFLAELAEAAVVEPDLRNLPPYDTSANGGDQTWPRFLARQRILCKGGGDRDRNKARKRLSDSALFVQELAAVVSRKSGSGSLRTRCSWAAYRARQLDSPSVGERAALAIFRLVGYGHRVVPPLLAWLVVSLVAVPAVLWARHGAGLQFAFDATGVGTFVTAYVEMLLSPFVLVRLAADPQVQDLSSPAGQLVLLARAAAAVPFVFCTIAAARYLRADWPWHT